HVVVAVDEDRGLACSRLAPLAEHDRVPRGVDDLGCEPGCRHRVAQPLRRAARVGVVLASRAHARDAQKVEQLLARTRGVRVEVRGEIGEGGAGHGADCDGDCGARGPLIYADSRPDAAMPNRLIRETSPYLRQHAHNPVDWYPWGPEALARARQLDRPIFLSVGYSACHWCHVMEHESFEDEEVAGILNENFVSIKVDREERPDLDQI